MSLLVYTKAGEKRPAIHTKPRKLIWKDKEFGGKT